LIALGLRGANNPAKMIGAPGKRATISRNKPMNNQSFSMASPQNLGKSLPKI
jgi:hypothetical protein